MAQRDSAPSAPLWRRPLVWAVGAALIIAALGVVAGLTTLPELRPEGRDGRIPIAVVGDSDSHSYQDRIFLSNPADRGGAYRPTTYQWTEVLAMLRGHEVDLGEWGTWGTRSKIAALLRILGFDGRAPRKQDYRFNYAVSGATCDALFEPPLRQAESLLRMMNEDRRRWQRGIVVIRIGINSVGRTRDLEYYAVHGLDETVERRLRDCANQVGRAAALIRAQHPRTLVVVVGMSDNTHWALNLGKWRDSPRALARIGDVMQRFDGVLAATVSGDDHAVFFSDRLWFESTWGTRDASGAPAYRSVGFGGSQAVYNAQGDHPVNVTLADGHAGTISNGLWARDLVALLRARFSVPITPIDVVEVARLADPRGDYGIAPPPFK
jgi:hypothetical protein